MSRFRSAFRTTAGSATLPIASIYASASGSLWLREVWVTNTTATDVAIRVIRVSTTGTQGAAQTVQEDDDGSVPALASPRTTHSVAPTLGDEVGRITLGAAIGGGAILPFGDKGIRIPTGTGNGIALLPVGTGQVCDVVLVWDE
jgi:hypothetical protein